MIESFAFNWSENSKTVRHRILDDVGAPVDGAFACEHSSAGQGQIIVFGHGTFGIDVFMAIGIDSGNLLAASEIFEFSNLIFCQIVMLIDIALRDVLQRNRVLIDRCRLNRIDDSVHHEAGILEAKEYANFVLKGYEFHKFNDEDIQILKNDWETVRNFIIKIQKCYPDNPELQYPRISFELRDKLMYIDTAPKWPNPPRFRLKRSAVTAMVQSYFNNAQFEELKEHLNSFSEFDQKLHDLTMKYQGKTIADLISIFGIPVPDINKLNKAISEQIVVRMFDGKSSKINKIDLFAKVGIIAKTICLSSKGGRTEDTKLFPIDFSELENTDIEFEDSSIYDYFMNHQVLCIIFEEKNKEQNFKENKFKGFKRISYDYDFINTEVRHTWEDLRNLILKKGLRETPELKKDGTKKINPNGLEATSINFPKSCDHVVFVRGGGIDSSVKPCCIQGIHMYRQYIWIKGKYMVDRLKKTDLI